MGGEPGVVVWLQVPVAFGVVGERKDGGFPLKTAGMTGGVRRA